jgi:NarL family two-component system response regulator LiaR
MTETNETIRVLIADDHAVVREGLSTLIGYEPGMDLVGEAADGIEAVQLARDLEPDVILLDMVMPRMDGLEAIGKIKQDVPSACILVLSSFSDDDRVFGAIKAGALGYLLKDSSPATLIQSIRDVYRNEFSLSPGIARKVMAELQRSSDLPPTEEPLTVREVEVLKLVAQGLTNQDIGDRLSLSVRTVRNHVSSILEKLYLANRTQAALYAIKEGLVDLDDL